MYNRTKFIFVVFVFALTLCASCNDDGGDDESNPRVTPPVGWTEATHGKTHPAYEIVFPQNEVNTIHIKLTTADWTAITNDMTTLQGPFGGPVGGGNGGGRKDFDFGPNPIYRAVSVVCNETEWYKVGFRLKGNSSLGVSWSSGIYKLPFRLKFDEFETTYPQIDDQRFYGFKELSFAPGMGDYSLIREKIATDLFRSAGIPAPQTSFYRVFIDFGKGEKYCGVYTMVEVVDDTMIKTQFGSEDGNIYKPFSMFDAFVEDQFEKKNNEELRDFSDVQWMIESLNAPLRVTDPEAWRENLEQFFDADHFIRWLAVNSTMVNWDVYGAIQHNYYLYNKSGRGLVWIPWDNNEALAKKWIDSDLSHKNVLANWALIRFLLDDPVYLQKYRQYVKDFASGPFAIDKVNASIKKYHSMIAPFVTGPQNEERGKYSHLPDQSAFNSSSEILQEHVRVRHDDVAEFLK